eukprot:363754-Chlamydomonas_euryale.AAC.8
MPTAPAPTIAEPSGPKCEARGRRSHRSPLAVCCCHGAEVAREFTAAHQRLEQPRTKDCDHQRSRATKHQGLLSQSPCLRPW